MKADTEDIEGANELSEHHWGCVMKNKGTKREVK
jgi:hypothetical protein